MNKIKKQRFTLIELLLVMGLMGLMVTLALPAFSRMAGNNKIDIMTSNIKTALEQGQSTAVSRNCYVAVVFPLAAAEADVKDYNFGGYRLAEVKPTGTNGTDYTFVKWISESYMNKPDGAYIVGSSTKKFSPDATDESTTHKKVPSEVKTGNFEKFEGIKGSVPDVDLTKCKAVIFKSTGECVNSDMYICIANADADTLKVSNMYDYRQLELNQFTGRVDYVSDEDESSNNNTGGGK